MMVEETLKEASRTINFQEYINQNKDEKNDKI